MAELPRDVGMRWWVASMTRTAEGQWRVLIQFADGSTIAPLLLPADDMRAPIQAAAEAHLRGDRRWTKRSERG